MDTIRQILEQLCSQVVTADATDLPALAAMHSQLQNLRAAIDEGRTELGTIAGSLSTTTEDARTWVEKIILNETEDIQSALRCLCESVTQIQTILEQKTDPLAIPVIHEANKPQSTPAPCAGPVNTAVTFKPDDLPLVNEFVTEAAGHIESAEAAILKLETSPEDAESINAVFRGFHTIKGVAGFLGLSQIGSLSHAAESLLDLARKGQFQLDSSAIDLVLESMDLMKALIQNVAHAANSGTPIADEPRLSFILNRLHAAASGKSSTVAAAPAEIKSATQSASTTAAGAADVDATVKVSTARLDNLINMVGELVIASSMVQQDVTASLAGNQRLSRHMSHLGKLTRELQELSMSMRMVPINGVFQKMARLVRDLSHKSGKPLDLVLTGAETELDRNVVEAIHDPLVHMVRNAADHGIEPADQLAAAGKNATGRIELKASHQAGNIVIEIIDDGRGLNKEKILRKAIDAGLIKSDEQLTDQDIFRLIFHPGLSTAEKVTDVSGRGVGMDVVKRNVESLRGRIDIASTPGKGSTFTVRLPLTLAVIDGLVIHVGSQRFILPLTSVEQSLRPRIEQLSTVQYKGEMCMVRQTLLPLFRLHNLFKITPQTTDPTQALVVIVQDNSRRCCILVDEIVGQQQVVIKTLGAGIGAVKGISGGAILGDGNISLILDIPTLIELATNSCI